MIVVDMQAGLLNGPPKHDLPGVIDRINLLTAMVRRQPGRVVWIRHCGRPGDGFEPGTPGWEFLPALVREHADVVIEKRLNDPFAGTALQQALDPDRSRSRAGRRLGHRLLRRRNRQVGGRPQSSCRRGQRRPHAE
jgi:nicotinamidase-related amidase